MGKSPLVLVIVTSLVVGLLVFSFTPDMSDFAARYFLRSNAGSSTPEVAKFTQVEGKVWRRQHGAENPTRLRKTGTLFHHDLLTVELHSHLDLRFPSGDEIRLEEKTKAVVEYWNPADSNSPIYLTVLMGDFSLLKAGQRGKLFVVMDKQLFSPGFRPEAKAFVLRLRSSELGLVGQDQTGAAPEGTTPDDGEEDGKLAPSEKTAGLAATLTNQYIEEVISGQKRDFQRCQANAIREIGQVKGQVLVGFTIQPRGKIEDSKILQTTIDNKQLMDCLLTVFKNSRFQEFTGAPIVRSYPLSFE